MPVAALVDYELTLSLPPRVTADTGIDALTHAIEAYVSKKANLFSDARALAAMRLIGPNLRKVYHDGADRAAREAVMLGSTIWRAGVLGGFCCHGAWHEPPNWRRIPCASWFVERHAAPRSDGILDPCCP